MRHLGDITKISGYDTPMVDVIIGGSPCQDLSVAGKRAGLEGERSHLFLKQIRIIKEMRDRDVRVNGRPDESIRPRYMVWENVCGAFSSPKGNKGEDFRVVLEETAKIADPTVEENASHLLQILEDNPHPKYYLSATACKGIITRAERRGKTLPPILREALEQMIALEQTNTMALSSETK